MGPEIDGRRLPAPADELRELVLPGRPQDAATPSVESARARVGDQPPRTMQDYLSQFPGSEQLFIDPATGRSAAEQIELIWPDRRVEREFQKHERSAALAESRLSALEERMDSLAGAASRTELRALAQLRRLHADAEHSLAFHSEAMDRFGDANGPNPAAFRAQETERLQASQYEKFLAANWNRPDFHPNDVSQGAIESARQATDPLRYAMRPGAAPGEVASINDERRQRQEEGLRRAADERAARAATARAERDQEAAALRARARAGEFRVPGTAMSMNDMELARERVELMVAGIRDNPLSADAAPSAAADLQRTQAYQQFREQAITAGFESLPGTGAEDVIREAGLRSRATEDQRRGIHPFSRGQADAALDPEALARDLRARGLTELSQTIGMRLMDRPNEPVNLGSFLAQLPDGLSGVQPAQRQYIMTNIANGLAWNAQRAERFDMQQVTTFIGELDRLGVSAAEQAQLIKPIAEQIALRTGRGGACDYERMTALYQAIDNTSLADEQKLALLGTIGNGIIRNLTQTSSAAQVDAFQSFTETLPQRLALTAASNPAAQENQRRLLESMSVPVTDLEQPPRADGQQPVVARINPGTALYREVLDLFQGSDGQAGVTLHAQRSGDSWSFTLRSRGTGTAVGRFTLEAPTSEALREALVDARSRL